MKIMKVEVLQSFSKGKTVFLSFLSLLAFCFLMNDARALSVVPDPDAENPGFLSVIAGGVNNVAGSPALTFSFGALTVALAVDQQDRIYFEHSGIIRRTESDGTISEFTAGENVSDFYIHENYLYFIDFNDGVESIISINLDTGSQEIVATSADFACCGLWPKIAALTYEGIVFVFVMTGESLFTINSSTGEVFQQVGYCTIASCEDRNEDENYTFGGTDLRIDPDGLVVLFSDVWGNIFQYDGSGTGITLLVNIPVYVDPLGPEGLYSFDLLSNGDILATDSSANVWRVSRETGSISIVAGNGTSATTGDGKSALAAAIQPLQIAVDQRDNFYFSSAIRISEREPVSGQRIRFVDTEKDIVSSVIGAPGSLACQGPTESLLLRARGITVDSNGITYIYANDAILAIDTKLDVIYSVAGLYGTRGNSADGMLAFANPISVYGEDVLAVAPNGDLYFAETDRLRRINHDTGLLETVVEGKFRWLDFNDNGNLYAVRQTHELHWDIYDTSFPEFVRIDQKTGDMIVLLSGGEQSPNIGASAQGVDFRDLYDFAVDSAENIYLLLDGYGYEIVYGEDSDLTTGIYVVNSQDKILRALVIEEFREDYLLPSPVNLLASGESSQLALDESRGLIYYTNLKDSGGRMPIVRYDMAAGQRVRFAGSGESGSYFTEDPLASSFYPAALALGPNGELNLIDLARQEESQYVLRISSSATSSALLPRDIEEGANLGQAVARSGEWMAIGVPNSDSGNGSTGEVLVYRDNGCRPILRNRLKTPGGQTTHKLGQLVTFSGDALIVGSSEEQTQMTQSESKQSDSSFLLGTFLLEDGNWQFDRDLSGLLPAGAGDSAMTLVSDGSRFAVGVTAANGGQGEVLVFDSKNLQAPSILQSNSDVTRFGLSLAMSDGRLAVGADSNQGGGVAELFQYEGSSYQFLDVAKSDQIRPGFAAALALSDEALYVGAPDASGGRVFGFTISKSMQLSDTLKDPENASNPSFGTALAIEDGVLVVGAPETTVAVVQSKQSQLEATGDSSKPNVIPGTGAVHIFGIKDGSGRGISGIRLFSLFASSAEGYGKSVDISKGRIVVGAPQTDNGRGSFESVGEMVNAAALSGLWYDPALEGEGFNVLVADAGMVVYFYGYDSDGQRLWLVSETLTGEFGFGEDINLKVYKAREGEFVSPVSSSESLVEYGLLSMSSGYHHLLLRLQ